MNYENDPLINGAPNDPIIKIVHPPPLHTVLLGPVNHIYKELQNRFPEIDNTISKMNIQKSSYHGQNFEGNQCRAILKNIKSLEIPNEFLEFQEVFLALRKLHYLCNG